MLLQTEIPYIADLIKLGPVVTVLVAVVWHLWKENKRLKEEIKDLQSEVKTEIKASTAFAEQLKAFIEKLNQ